VLKRLLCVSLVALTYVTRHPGSYLHSSGGRRPYQPRLHSQPGLTLSPSDYTIVNMATTSQPASSPALILPLLRLPAELHLEIVSELQESDGERALARLNLRLSNRYFYNLIDKPSHFTLLNDERTPWAVARSLYTCRYCTRLRRASNFAGKMLKGKTGLNGGEPNRRFCADCGFAPPKG
jgi:hypothetical protein